MRRLLFIASVLLVVLCAGCISHGTRPLVGPVDGETVQGHRYYIVATHDATGDYPAVSATGPPWVLFAEQLAFSDGCNSTTSDYEIDSDGYLTVTNGDTTLIGCFSSPVGDQARRISETLTTGARLESVEGSIVVTNDATSVTLST